ncbi:MAG: hypothetical protein COU06_01630 [Candidatus Harrisonbacteria bacterium CG10_big_fil_rev_8_21_14_0_10_38_8]|uniref:Uncharacterized protein n=1 Tax=Candidatus Harrisonbacteria bacterium CG10_big_fil_rev_8_21_14_0_10_38_8 TaxID=1974582 RepID=A0A2M6WJY8_9BACT|nr:MAG: hypothetical protein COU06_01630 [Candidatus Harrisonbacteria bacterium CG10_big_fil_rev_8_21_14_0_10_38_8]
MFAKVKSFLFTHSSDNQVIVKNTFWLFLGELFGRVIRVFVVILIARYLSIADYGLFSYVLTISAFLTIFTDIGIGAVVTRESAKDKSLRKVYLATALGIKFVMIIISIALVFSFAQDITKINGIAPLLLPLSFLFVFDSLRDFIGSFIRSLEKMELEAYVKIVTNSVLGVIVVIVLLNQATTYLLIWAYAIGTGVGLVLSLFYVREYLSRIFFSFDRSLVKKIIFTALPVGMLMVLGALMLNTDMIMLGWWTSAEEIGYYSAALKIIMVLYVIPNLISSSIFPSLSRYDKDNIQKFREVFERGITLSLAIALPFCLGGVVVAKPLLISLFGGQYEPAVTTFVILLLSLPIVFTTTLFSNGLFALNLQNRFIIFVLIGLVSNIVFNWLLIPVMGIMGVAYATILSQLISNSLLWIFMKRSVEFKILRHLPRILLSATLMSLVAVLLSSFNVFLVILLCLVFYLILLYALKEPCINIRRNF